ncbi:methyltransferase domain-containing protein [Marinibacterium profundimaris]|uniref:SAM-dependent methyltransferase n=1 Tax=Marinibacterium profundimaris TaxID=1679460 RepID=A0A225NN89_9RHOB|nr:methyltransferase domain-containing protein [Marinibacterium profundimaris]OWU75759.1 SAM-dependent methyltransferase [Marinibacterium profundimaris]
MNAPRRLTDRPALDRHRERARARAEDPFLHRLARDEAQDRLALVNRTFTKLAVVSPFPELWDGTGARVVPDTEVLDLEPEAHDCVVHAMALHWADDPVGQLIQCRRALQPDGFMVAILPGGRSFQELRAVLAQAETELKGGLSPRVLPMADIRDLGALLQRAGMALPVADSDTFTLTYRDLPHLAADLRASGETNALEARLRGATPRGLFARAAELYGTIGATPDGRLAATLELITLTGWAPGPNQPQPLRPGSATERLADALNTSETRLPD